MALQYNRAHLSVNGRWQKGARLHTLQQSDKEHTHQHSHTRMQIHSDSSLINVAAADGCCPPDASLGHLQRVQAAVTVCHRSRPHKHMWLEVIQLQAVLNEVPESWYRLPCNDPALTEVMSSRRETSGNVMTPQTWQLHDAL